jgi:hypothetical protein
MWKRAAAEGKSRTFGVVAAEAHQRLCRARVRAFVDLRATRSAGVVRATSCAAYTSPLALMRTEPAIAQMKRIHEIKNRMKEKYAPCEVREERCGVVCKRRVTLAVAKGRNILDLLLTVSATFHVRNERGATKKHSAPVGGG